MYALRTIDDLVYVLSAYTAVDVPAVVRDFYPTGIPASVAIRNLGIVQLDGLPLKHIIGRSGHYEIANSSVGRVEVVLERGDQTTSDFSDMISVPKPKTRRHGAVSWDQGVWVISRRGRREVISSEASIITPEIVLTLPQQLYHLYQRGNRARYDKTLPLGTSTPLK